MKQKAKTLRISLTGIIVMAFLLIVATQVEARPSADQHYKVAGNPSCVPFENTQEEPELGSQPQGSGLVGPAIEPEPVNGGEVGCGTEISFIVQIVQSINNPYRLVSKIVNLNQ